MRRITLSLLALTVVAAAGCGTDDDRPWTDTDPDTVAVTPTPEMRAQFTALRSEVDSVVGHLRSEVETRQEGVTGDTLDAWTDTYAKVAERRADLLVKLDELDRASVDEARSIRNDVAEEMAELEADVVRQKLRLERDHQAAMQAIEEHLVRLEQDLDTIAAHAQRFHGQTAGVQQGVDRQQDTRAMGGTAVQRTRPGEEPARDTERRDEVWRSNDHHDHIPDLDEIQSLREEIHETRRDAAEITTLTGDDRRDRIDSVSDQVADLTREIRKHWYNVRYTFTGSGMPGEMDRQRMDDDTQY